MVVGSDATLNSGLSYIQNAIWTLNGDKYIPHSQVVNHAMLILSNITEENSGVYICKTHIDQYTYKSAEIVLTFYGKKIITNCHKLVMSSVSKLVNELGHQN